MESAASLEGVVQLGDLERLAQPRVERTAWDYYASGANDELTLRDNRAAFERLKLHYRVLVDVSLRELGVELLGERLALPVAIAPTAFHKLAHPDGEVATARAAGGAGTLMILSTLSNTAIEDVIAAATGPVWFQLYVYRDRAATEALIERVERAGARALVLTVDAPLLGQRERDLRNRFALPDGLGVENMLAHGMARVDAPDSGSGLAGYFARLLDPSLSWKDLEWLCARTRLPVLVKGVVRADDARRARDHGAAGVVVSNHGGRQLDTAPATLDALPHVTEALDGSLPVLLDGGIRRGTDVIKALALGARTVLIGRPVLWGLAAGGEAGVSRALAILRDELDLALALCGCPSVADVGPDLLSP